jgi:hypothetical protein
MNSNNDTVQPESTGNNICVSMGEANRLAIPLVFLSIVLVVSAHWVIWGRASVLQGFHVFSNLLFFVPTVVIGSLLHEVLHAVGWVWFGLTPITTIKFGFQLEAFTMYAQCCVPLESTAYRAGTALPGVVLGVIPVLIGVVSGLAWVTMCGALFLGVASGDALVIWMIRSVPPGARVTDHPTKAGCQVIADLKGQISNSTLVQNTRSSFEYLQMPRNLSRS